MTFHTVCGRAIRKENLQIGGREYWCKHCQRTVPYSWERRVIK